MRDRDSLSLGEGTPGGMRSARSEGSSGSGLDSPDCGEQTPQKSGGRRAEGKPSGEQGPVSLRGDAERVRDSRLGESEP